MAGASTSDVWGRTSDIDESALAVMAARLENRAKHPFFRGVIADYIGALELKLIANVIEIGCGTGVVSRRLAATPGFRGTIVATDMSLVSDRDRAAGTPRTKGVDARITFEVSGAANLRAENGACDLVIAHTLLSHASDPVAILAESARVLRPGGQLLIFDRDFASSALSLDSAIAAKIDVADIARAFAAQPFIMRQLPKLLAEAGFAIETHRSYVIADVGHAEFFAENLSTWRRLLPVSGVIAKERCRQPHGRAGCRLERRHFVLGQQLLHLHRTEEILRHCALSRAQPPQPSSTVARHRDYHTRKPGSDGNRTVGGRP